MDNKFNKNTQVQNISRAKENNIIKDNFIMLSHAANFIDSPWVQLWQKLKYKI